MSSGKSRSKGGNSPTSSPPLPPAPTQAKNIGSAAPHHYQTELASPEAAATKAGNGRLTPTRTRSNNIKDVAASASTKRGQQQPTLAPPALANGTDVIHSTTLQKKWSLRRLARLGLLLYLGYTIFFVCPLLSDSKTNLVCNSVSSVKDRLRPYTQPVVGKVGETYKTYGVPYVDQFGRPLYAQGQKYYVDVAQPTIKTAKDAYHQYAHPHVNKAYQAVYTPQVKYHINRAQTAFNGYQKQAQDQIVYARKLSKDANDNVWRHYATHVQPVVDKVTPHAKVAWNRASVGANHAYNTASDLYLKHVNPYALQTYAVILDAADNARESFAFHTDEIWGTKLSKRHKKSKAARAADAAADKARQAKLAVENAAQKAAKNLKHEPEPETLKDTLLKKVAEAQKLAEEYADGAREAFQDTVTGAQKAAGDYSDTIKAAVYGSAGEAKKATDQAAKDAKATVPEKAYDAQKVAEEFIENVRDSAAKKAHDAKEAASDNAQYLKNTADDKVYEAGKLSERTKKAVIDKAHEAQEAVARQAEQIRHAAQEQVDHVQETGAHLRDNVVGVAHDAKEAVDKEAEYVADVAQKKKQQAEKEARKWADQAARVAQENYDAATDGVNEIKAKVVKTADDANQAIHHQADEASQHAQDAFVYVDEETEEARDKAAKAAKKAKKAARKQAKELKKAAEKAAHDGQEYQDVPAEAAENAKDFVVQHVKDASSQGSQATEAAKQKVFNASTASKASLAAMLAGIETSFGRFYDYEDTETKNLWSKLQSAIDEHVESAKKSAHDLEKANRVAYESFESYVRDWRNQGGGDLDDRLAKLKQQSIESVKNIGQRAESDQTAAKSKVKVLANNVDVYLNGLKDFLADRLQASTETIASELNVFKDTSSKDDEETVRGKLAQLEAAARTRMDDAGKDAHTKAQQLLKQVDEIWSQSEAQSRELAAKAQELARKASEDAQLAIQHAAGGDAVDDKERKQKKSTVEEAPGSLRSKIHSVKDTVVNHANEAKQKVDEMLHDRRDSGFSGGDVPADSENSDNVRVVVEEPGSGHRHHRH
ncbi:hypothetical protein EC957_004200 [Mortierella hygrophila]|uniref:Uncharacterized protein n=1 Tax=Mortierella hygrophila TaxID=979708 RepID=A0A9P6FF15_9FUNG|nr:hypothetical protein EC957_004200 [Mortierella hygrophila]